MLLNKEGYDHLRTELNLKIGTEVRTYTSDDGKARLVLRPLEEMTWWNLWALAQGIRMFCREEVVMFRFHIYDRRPDRVVLVGSGDLGAV